MNVHGGRIVAYGFGTSASVAIQADIIEVYGGDLQAETTNACGIGFNDSFNVHGGYVSGCIVGTPDQSYLTISGGEVHARDPKGGKGVTVVKGVTGVNCTEIYVDGGKLDAIGGDGDGTISAGAGIICSVLNVDHGGSVHAAGGDNAENPGLAISANHIYLGDGFHFFQSETGDFQNVESSNPPCTMRFAEIHP